MELPANRGQFAIVYFSLVAAYNSEVVMLATTWVAAAVGNVFDP